jgi:hypothetical protein
VAQEFERMEEDDVSSEPSSYDSMASDFDDNNDDQDASEEEAFSDSGKIFF